MAETTRKTRKAIKRQANVEERAAAKLQAATSPLTGKVAGWSARHKFTVLFGTLGVIVLAIWGNVAFGVETSNVQGVGDAREGMELVDARFADAAPPAETVLITNPDLSATDPGFQSYVEEVAVDLRGIEGVESVSTYYDVGAPYLVSDTMHSVLTQVTLIKDEEVDAVAAVQESLRAMAADGPAGYEIGIIGETSMNKGFEQIMGPDMMKVLLIALTAGFIVILLVFGSVVAALIPLGMGIVAIIATIGAAVPVSAITPLNQWYYEMVVLIGLAVGVDYSLFVVSRYREYRRDGVGKLAAITQASSTTGRTVFYAGIAVLLSLSGLLITQDSLFIGLGLGAVIVVFFAVILAMTFLPALLSLLGDKISWGRIPGLGRHPESGGIWGRISKKVMKRPATFAAATIGAFLILAIPMFSLHIGATPAKNMIDWDAASEIEELELLANGIDILDREFDLDNSSEATVVVDPGDGLTASSPEITAAIDRLRTATEADSSFSAPVLDVTNPAGDLVLVSVPIAAAADGAEGEAAVRELRSEIIPETMGSVDATVLVTGELGYIVDGRDNIYATAPIVFVFVLGLAFILLLVMFRSVVIPITAILANLLSVAAAYGILVGVFQFGWAESLLGIAPSGIIEMFMPLFLFTVLFGLSMDYHMLLLGRIKELRDQGMSTSDAVASGIAITARQITSAALIMVLVFGAFAASGIMIFKQMGVGLGVAILLDATLIRGVLIPAVMKMLGDRSWYLPKWLEWLPQVKSHEELAPRVTAIAVETPGQNGSDPAGSEETDEELEFVEIGSRRG